MRIVKRSLVLILIIFCASFLSINSHVISVKVLPTEINKSNTVINLPAYVAFVVFMALGLLMGTLFEHFRARQDRRKYKKSLREVEQLEAKINQLTKDKTTETDEILRLLK